LVVAAVGVMSSGYGGYGYDNGYGGYGHGYGGYGGGYGSGYGGYGGYGHGGYGGEAYGSGSGGTTPGHARANALVKKPLPWSLPCQILAPKFCYTAL